MRRSLLFAFASIAAGQQISSGCSTFLGNLDADLTLKQCTSNLLNVTAAFNPTSTTKQPSLTSIKDTLVAVCQTSIDFCDLPTLSAVLNAFAGNCSVEITGSNAVTSVVSLYDAMYIVKPLKDAMCSTNSKTGNSCMLEIAGTSNHSVDVSANATVPQKAVSDIAPANSTVRTYAQLAATFDVSKYAGAALMPANLYVQAGAVKASLGKRWTGLLRRAPGDASASASATGATVTKADDPTAGIVTANATTFQQTYLPYLFLNPAMPTAQLCQPCTQAVMAAYVAFESVVPYAGGLPNSYLLSAQSSFWKSLGVACGSTFLTEINGQAGQTVDEFSGAVGLRGSGLAALVVLVSYILVR